MRRTLAVALGLLLVFPAGAGAVAADEPPRLGVTLAACSTGATDAERFGVFTASMPALPGTVRMAMRFALRERTAGSRWTRVHAGGFGRWERSDWGRAGFVYTKRVERMRRVADYRVVVRFRWEQADGTRRRQIRRSPVCRQPDPRPDLELASIEVAPGSDADSARYRVTALNTGRGAAGAFAVRLAGGGRDDVRAVGGLPAGERVTVELVGPRCEDVPGVEVVLDVVDVVDESDERDNRSGQLCGGR